MTKFTAANGATFTFYHTLKDWQEDGFQQVKTLAGNATSFATAAKDYDYKGWANETFVNNPVNAKYLIECASFVFKALTNLALVIGLAVVAKNLYDVVANVFRGAGFNVMAQNQADQNAANQPNQAKYELARNILKLGAFVAIPGGLYGLAAYLMATHLVDSVSDRAMLIDEHGTMPIKDAYMKGAEQTYNDVTSSIAASVSF